jgi:EpsD family peptidyl-prolyl cis-trans isomerase
LSIQNRSGSRCLPVFVVAVPLFIGVTLIGCSSEVNEPDSATQVAAVVNGDEITVHQINDALAKRESVAGSNTVAFKQAVLEQLIDQQIAVQQAMEAKLDRSPKVMRAMEAAKKEVLARAYLEHLIESAPQRYEWDMRNQEEIRKYYNDHPELFEKRRVFTIEEINFVAAGDVVAKLRAYASGNAGMQEIADWLKARDVKFEAKRGVRAAEQISLNILPVVQTLSQGEIRLFVLGEDRYQVLRVVNSREAPVDEATAAPRIQQFLANQQSTQVLTTEMKRVRQAAEIEYLGEFVAASANATATGEAIESDTQ